MITPEYDKTKTINTNVMALFRFTNWLYREMLMGRVKMNTDKTAENEQEILQTQANFVQAVEDEYNALIES